ARRLRPVDLDDPAARQAADAEGDVEAERAGRDDLDVVDDLTLAEPHDRALAMLLLDLRESGRQGLGFFGVEGFDGHVHEGLLRVRRLSAKAGCLYSSRRARATLPSEGRSDRPRSGGLDRSAGDYGDAARCAGRRSSTASGSSASSAVSPSRTLRRRAVSRSPVHLATTTVATPL